MATKRIRINTSVIELTSECVNVYRKGEQVKTITSTYFELGEFFVRECELELKRHINRQLAD